MPQTVHKNSGGGAVHVAQPLYAKPVAMPTRTPVSASEGGAHPSTVSTHRHTTSSTSSSPVKHSNGLQRDRVTQPAPKRVNLLCLDLSRMGRRAQLLLLSSGVFLFFCANGYVEKFIFRRHLRGVGLRLRLCRCRAQRPRRASATTPGITLPSPRRGSGHGR